MDEVYRYIGYGLVSILLFYIATRSLRFQLGVVEGLVGIKKEKKPEEQKPKEDKREEEEEEEEDT